MEEISGGILTPRIDVAGIDRRITDGWQIRRDIATSTGTGTSRRHAWHMADDSEGDAPGSMFDTR